MERNGRDRVEVGVRPLYRHERAYSEAKKDANPSDTRKMWREEAMAPSRHILRVSEGIAPFFGGFGGASGPAAPPEKGRDRPDFLLFFTSVAYF